MTRRVRTRFWVEAGGALGSAVLLVVTLISSEWIELLFGVNPDVGSGVFEWGLVMSTMAAAAVLSLLARREWHDTATAET